MESKTLNFLFLGAYGAGAPGQGSDDFPAPPPGTGYGRPGQYGPGQGAQPIGTTASPYGTGQKPYGQDQRSYGQDQGPYGQDQRPYGGQDQRPYGGQDQRPYGGQDQRPYGGQDQRPYGGQGGLPYDQKQSKLTAYVIISKITVCWTLFIIAFSVYFHRENATLKNLCCT